MLRSFCISLFSICAMLSLSLPASAQDGTGDTVVDVCMDDLFPGKLNCNANDVRIAQALNLVILDDGCKFPGDDVTFAADFEVVLTAQERHDIGIFFSVDGDPNLDGALSGTCAISSLPEVPDPPLLQE